MKYPYLLLSDTHYHAWDAFSTINEDGVNSRLQIILDETGAAFEHLVREGGDTVFHAGDMFHTRGSLVPSVVNPTRRLYQKMQTATLGNVYAIAGNHDLESNETKWLTAATAMMGVIFAVDTKRVGNVILVNWYPRVEDLYDDLVLLAAKTEDRADCDLIIHAPVDGILSLPNHGLTASMLASLGFKRVFSGHYHNHKDMGSGVYSIGALTHQTWSDVGSKAGYCLVYEDRVEWHESKAPKFVDLPPAAFEEKYREELVGWVKGNYCRVSLPESPTVREEAAMRAALKDSGAVGVLLRCANLSRTAMTTKRSETSGIDNIATMVDKYAELKGGKDLAALCAKILGSESAGVSL